MGEEVQFHSFVTSALDGVSGQVFAPTVLCPGKITKPGLSPGFVMHKGIPIAIVRLRHKIL